MTSHTQKKKTKTATHDRCTICNKDKWISFLLNCNSQPASRGWWLCNLTLAAVVPSAILLLLSNQSICNNLSIGLIILTGYALVYYRTGRGGVVEEQAEEGRRIVKERDLGIRNVVTGDFSYKSRSEQRMNALNNHRDEGGLH